LVARYRRAMEHPSEEALKTYMHEHPQADPKNHTVKPKSEKPKKEDDKGSPKDKPKAEEPGKAKGSWFKGLSEKAKAFVSHSSAAVQKFVSDEVHRAKVLEDAGKSILASPKTYAKRLVETAKHEVHEFKEAGQAVKHLAQGKKLEPQQKKALKTVAIHMGIAVAAAALTSTGVLAGAAALGKGMVQKIALKAATKSLEKIHLVQEISHIGHGIHHLMELVAAEDEEPRKIEKIDPEEAFALLVMQSVVKEMKELNEDDLTEILEEASGEQQKAAWKLTGASAGDLVPTLTDAEQVMEDLGEWIGRFPKVLLAARAESPTLDNRVWQERIVDFFKQRDYILVDKLDALDEQLNDIYLDVSDLANVANEARHLLKIPRKAQTEFAISDIEFSPSDQGGDRISYSIPRLKDWSAEFEKWVATNKRELKGLVSRANQIIKRKKLV